jgi:hypothetical protein
MQIVNFHQLFHSYLAQNAKRKYHRCGNSVTSASSSFIFEIRPNSEEILCSGEGEGLFTESCWANWIEFWFVAVHYNTHFTWNKSKLINFLNKRFIVQHVDKWCRNAISLSTFSIRNISRYCAYLAINKYKNVYGSALSVVGSVLYNQFLFTRNKYHEQESEKKYQMIYLGNKVYSILE